MNTVIRFKPFLLALFILALLYTPSVFAVIYIPQDTSVGTWDSVNRIYTLNSDINDYIVVRENNLTLDGAGHTLTSINISPSWAPGVHLSGSTGVTVTGLTLEEFSTGIYLDSATGNTIIGNTLISNNPNVSSNQYGILLLHGGNNIVADNIIDSNNGYTGIGITYRSNNNVISNNTVTGNRTGVILLYHSNGNTLTGNTISNSSTGISIVNNCINNTLTDNTLDSNTYAGMSVGGSDNILTDNRVSNSRYGILLSAASNFTLTDNVMTGSLVNFYIFGNTDAHFDNDIDTTNSVNGKPVFYIEYASDLVYDSDDAGAFIFTHGENITLSKSALSTDRVEVTLWDTHNSTLQNLNSNGITLRNSNNNNLTGNTANGVVYGIELYNSSDNNLSGNTANANQRDGMVLQYGSDNNTVSGNTISENGSTGISIQSSDGNTLSDNVSNSNAAGISASKTSGTAMVDNIIDSNGTVGISLQVADNAFVTGNTVHANNHGIIVGYSDGNILSDNTISNNLSYGLYLTSASNNQIYNNDFVSNAIQARDNNGIGNAFNLAAPDGGNTWSDWVCPDADHDGFVDLPYFFAGGQDDLPRVPAGGCQNDFPIADAGPDQTSLIGVTVTFDGSGSIDSDGFIVSYEWNFGDSFAIETGQVLEHSYTETGVYNVTLTVTDNEGGTVKDYATVQVFTAGQAVEDLAATIEGMNLQQGIDNSLDSKLQATQDAIEALNADLRGDAINKLESFINGVEAQRGKALTNEEATVLVNYAYTIIAGINYTPPDDGGGGGVPPPGGF